MHEQEQQEGNWQMTPARKAQLNKAIAELTEVVNTEDVTYTEVSDAIEQVQNINDRA